MAEKQLHLKKDKENMVFDKVGTLAIFIGILTSVQGAFNSGCLVTTLSSIQRRFRLTTFETAVILAAFDTGVDNCVLYFP